MDTARPRVRRPTGGGYAFACAPCALIYRDGCDYPACLRCESEVDWIDVRAPVWACPSCDVLVNREVTDSSCPSCSALMHLVATPEREQRRATAPPLSPLRVAGYLLALFVAVQTVFAIADPDAFPYLAPLLVIAQALGFVVCLGILVFAREIRGLLDHRTRILHGLEHATAAVLEERGFPVRSGVTFSGAFVLVLDHDGPTWERLDEIRAAAGEAIDRVYAGEHALAYTPQCGTSYLVGLCLYAFAIVAAGLTATFLGAPVGITWATTVAASLGARAIARPTGLAVQRWLTVSTDFAHATITKVDRRAMSDGDRLVMTFEIDVEPRARHGGLVPSVPW